MAAEADDEERELRANKEERESHSFIIIDENRVGETLESTRRRKASKKRPQLRY